MTLGNSTLRIFLILGFLVLVSCNGLATKNHPPLVFALNLSDTAVSLALVKGESAEVTFSRLGPLESSHLTKVEVSNGDVLRQGRGEEAPSKEWTDPAGTPYSLRMEPGHIYAIVVDPLGKAALYSLPESYNSLPKLCIVNVLPDTLPQVQAAPDWAKNVKVYSQDLAPVVPSEVFSFEPKTLGLYWQTKDQLSQGRYTEAKSPDGKPLRQTFVSGHLYLFLAGDGTVRDLTPPLD